MQEYKILEFTKNDWDININYYINNQFHKIKLS